MNRRWLKRTLFALLSGVPGGAFAGVERVEFADAVYHLYRVDRAAQAALELFWLGDDGKPLSSLAGLKRHLEQKGKGIAFATNAGIFEHGPKPLGLTISGGKELVPLNLAAGEGNFYLKPNGVFFLDDTLGPGSWRPGSLCDAESSRDWRCKAGLCCCGMMSCIRRSGRNPRTGGFAMGWVSGRRMDR